MKRTILAVAAGFVVWTVLWVAAGMTVQALRPESIAADGTVSSTGILLALIAASVVASLVGGGLVPRIAPDSARAPLALGVLLLVVGTGVEVAGWALTPLWYHLLFLILLVPVTLAGAQMVRRGERA